MKRRTFALLTAVITFTVGVVAARLALPNLFKTPPPVITLEIIRKAQAGDYRITGPYEFSNLKIFLIHGPDAPDSLVYTSIAGRDGAGSRARSRDGRRERSRSKISRSLKRSSFKQETS